MKLTNNTCKAAKPSDKPYKLSDGKGLFLLINAKGAKYWRYKYRYNGSEKLLSLGIYPEVSLAEARERHQQAHKLVSDGIDPSLHKLEAKVKRSVEANNTFEAVAREWLAKKETEVKPNTYKNIEDRLEMNLFPTIGKLPISSINAPILIDALKPIEKRGALDTVKRLRQYVGQIFRFAIAHGKATYNPAPDIIDALQTRKVEHFAAMTLEELPEFIHKLDRNEARLFPQTCLALRLMVLTFTRKSELAHAKWDEINLEEELWVIPPERMKMGQEHIVPLSKQAVSILEELHRMNGNWEYVFPSIHKPRQHMHEDTLLRALYRLGYKGKATIHGFRALAMTTIMEKLGYRYEVPDLQLAHSKGDKIRAAYDRTQFLDERKKMMQDWADYIDSTKS